MIERESYIEENHPLEGVRDIEFKSFMEEAMRIEASDEGLYDITAFVQDTFKKSYLSSHKRPLDFSINFSKRIFPLKKKGFVEFMQRRERSNTALKTYADFENFLMTASIAYAQKEADRQSGGWFFAAKLPEVMSLAEELWGDNERGKKLKAYKEGSFPQKKGPIRVSENEKIEVKIPPYTREFFQVTSNVLNTQLRRLKNEFPQWFVGSDIYVTPEKTGIPQAILKAMEFVRRVDTRDLSIFSPEEDYRTIYEIMGDMEYSKSKMEALDQKIRERGDERGARKANLAHLYISRVDFLRENPEILKNKKVYGK